MVTDGGHFSRTRTVQPVATCRQSPYVHKPAIVKLLLRIYSFHVCFPRNDHDQPTTPTSVTDTLALPTLVQINSSIDDASWTSLCLDRGRDRVQQ